MKITYNEESEISAIVEQKRAEGFTLVEIQTLNEGKFLIFKQYEPTTEERLAALEEATNLLLGL